MLEHTHSEPGKVISFPRIRRLSWTALSLEFAHQLVLSLWIGILVGTASLAVPALLETAADAQSGARAVLGLLSRVSILGCGAGSFLVLTTLLMHLLSIRSTRAALVQGGIVLLMAFLATALQLWLAPLLTSALRNHPDLFQSKQPGPELVRFRAHLTLYMEAMLLQAFLGSAQILLGIRRWYRYVAVRDARHT